MKMKHRLILCTLLMVFLFASTVFGVRVAELPRLSKPEMIEVSGERIYVVDGPSVKMFSLDD